MDDLISRQAAIDVAKEELDNGTFYDIPSKIEYLPFAQPTQSNTPNALTALDCISRQAAIDAVENIDCSDGVGISALKCDAVNDAVTAIKALPPAQSDQSNDSEFWRKRADYYSDLCMKLIGELGKGVQIVSVKISENGIEFIKEQPPAQPTEAEIQRMQDIEQAMLGKAYEYGKQDAVQWIPCSERLPGKDEPFYVLCCDKHGEIMIGHVFACNDGETPYSAESEHEYMYDCVAWCPLPEPWKGEKP